MVLKNQNTTKPYGCKKHIIQSLKYFLRKVNYIITGRLIHLGTEYTQQVKLSKL